MPTFEAIKEFMILSFYSDMIKCVAGLMLVLIIVGPWLAYVLITNREKK